MMYKFSKRRQKAVIAAMEKAWRIQELYDPINTYAGKNDIRIRDLSFVQKMELKWKAQDRVRMLNERHRRKFENNPRILGRLRSNLLYETRKQDFRMWITKRT